ncbi:hypothetical protein AD006_32705 (plasmid) [Pseudonocardia sp. EC080610-09]|uniref:hypothetical protein n=1 Tax=Pseudonocardia sp. EC080610-09 TaxID=1688404 RepID=UPI000706CA98|nr:hypothetical protein [Pseudonocardia sp. EC080610-09]ALL79974.1 hypothetical protein AD006_32705 [Pseudonocardia sp. EC080610-09]
MSFRPRRTATHPPAPAIPVLAPGQLWCIDRKTDLAEVATGRSAARPVLVTDASGQHTTTPMARRAEATTSTPARTAALVAAAAVAVAALALGQLALRHFCSSRTVGRRSR